MMTTASIGEGADAALAAAVNWCVRQESGRFKDSDRQAFEAWLCAQQSHRAAWARVTGTLQAPLATVRALNGPGQPAHARAAMDALFQVRRRRALRGALAVAGIGTTTCLIADRLKPLRELTADMHTATGERREFTLGDGTRIMLNARSAADGRSSEEGRIVELRAGALIATDAGGSHSPLHVQTVHGRVSSSGGQFACRLSVDATEAIALKNVLTVQPRHLDSFELLPGEGARFSARGFERLTGAAADRAAWGEGMLAVDNWSLGEVVDALRAYFPGFIRVSPAASPLRVFGTFRLDPTEALEALASMLPVRIHRLGPWLVSIDADNHRAAT